MCIYICMAYGSSCSQYFAEKRIGTALNQKQDPNLDQLGQTVVRSWRQEKDLYLVFLNVALLLQKAATSGSSVGHLETCKEKRKRQC